MNQKTLFKLEYDKIIALLEKEATSFRGGQLCRRLKPMTDLHKINTYQEQTAAAYTRIVQKGRISFGDAAPVEESMKRLEIGGSLSSTELLRISRLLVNAARVKAYGRHDTQEDACDCLDEYFNLLEPLTPLSNEIDRCIIGEDEYSDDASSTLKQIRRSINNINDKVHATLTTLVNGSLRTYLQDAIITMRGDRYCVPVKAEYRGQVQGLIHDQSSTGSTLFIEPMAIVKLNNDLKELYAKEQEEIQVILANLSEEAAQYIEEIRVDYRSLTDLDFIFARGALAMSMRASRPLLNEEGRIRIREGRHPLLDPKKVVPLTVTLGEDFTLLLITGPNTGGKTVSLKTVGLFCLMGQSGLHIPAGDRSELAVFHQIYADIGDEHTNEHSLRTFSSHMTNIVSILKDVTENSLVIFDELGAGTDPIEGAALAIAILEDVAMAGARCIATTHYTEIKNYALTKDGVENAAVEFDLDTLSPTYKLLIGVPGKSNAFEISKKLGLSDYIITRAKEFIDTDNIELEDILQSAEKNRIKAEEERIKAEKLRESIEKLKIEYDEKLEKFANQKEKMLEQARQEAFRITRQAKEEVDNIIKELRRLEEERASKEKNQQIEALRKELTSTMGSLQPTVKSMIVPKVASKEITDLKAGEDVRVITLNQEGTVVSVDKNKKEAVVQIGIMKMTLPFKSLQKVKKDVKKTVTKSTRNIIKSKSGNVKSEVDLRGMNLEEAIMEVEKYLDDAYVAGLENVTIIHGIGTGVLKSGLQDILRRNRHVKSQRAGQYGEGGAGVTIVTLK